MFQIFAMIEPTATKTPVTLLPVTLSATESGSHLAFFVSISEHHPNVQSFFFLTEVSPLRLVQSLLTPVILQFLLSSELLLLLQSEVCLQPQLASIRHFRFLLHLLGLEEVLHAGRDIPAGLLVRQKQMAFDSEEIDVPVLLTHSLVEVCQ